MKVTKAIEILSEEERKEKARMGRGDPDWVDAIGVAVRALVYVRERHGEEGPRTQLRMAREETTM